MNPDDAKAGETREWLDKAFEDLASARVLAGSGHFANALFFCQQAAEKGLKAFLTWHERPFRRTHDLEELGKAAPQSTARSFRCSKRRTCFRITHGSFGIPEHHTRRKGRRQKP
jgi:HEPN domain-containing protein